MGRFPLVIGLCPNHCALDASPSSQASSVQVQGNRTGRAQGSTRLATLMAPEVFAASHMGLEYTAVATRQEVQESSLPA